jgi:ABC-type amino acid transport substrate-binding protein
VTFLLSFSPWIAYAALSSVASWRVGVIVAVLVQVAVAVPLVRKRQIDLLSLGTFVFFGAMSVVALASPDSTVHRWIPALSAGALAVIAGSSLLAGRPFTLTIARRTTPQALWSRPEFIRINQFLTSVWGASFACSAIVCALLIGLVKADTVFVVLANVAAFAIPFYVTRTTVTRAQQKAAAAGLA